MRRTGVLLVGKKKMKIGTIFEKIIVRPLLILFTFFVAVQFLAISLSSTEMFFEIK